MRYFFDQALVKKKTQVCVQARKKEAVRAESKKYPLHLVLDEFTIREPEHIIYMKGVVEKPDTQKP